MLLLLGALLGEECVKMFLDALVQEASSTHNQNQIGSQAELSPVLACLPLCFAIPEESSRDGVKRQHAERTVSCG